MLGDQQSVQELARTIVALTKAEVTACLLTGTLLQDLINTLDSQTGTISLPGVDCDASFEEDGRGSG